MDGSMPASPAAASDGPEDQRRAVTTMAMRPAMPTTYGNAHATRLNPLSIGAVSTAWLPKSFTNAVDDLVVILAFGEK